MNNNSNPSANMPTQNYNYIPKSPGSISELAKYYYNTQIRDAHPASQRHRRTYSDSALHEPINTQGHRGTKKIGEPDHDFVNQYVYEGASEEGLEGSERKIDKMEEEERSKEEEQEEEKRLAPSIQRRIVKKKLPKPSPRDIEEWDELELIEREVWGDFSTLPTSQMHQSRWQGVTSSSKGRFVQGTSLPTAKRAKAPISIASYLLQG